MMQEYFSCHAMFGWYKQNLNKTLKKWSFLIYFLRNFHLKTCIRAHHYDVTGSDKRVFFFFYSLETVQMLKKAPDVTAHVSGCRRLQGFVWSLRVELRKLHSRGSRAQSWFSGSHFFVVIVKCGSSGHNRSSFLPWSLFPKLCIRLKGNITSFPQGASLFPQSDWIWELVPFLRNFWV